MQTGLSAGNMWSLGPTVSTNPYLGSLQQPTVKLNYINIVWRVMLENIYFWVGRNQCDHRPVILTLLTFIRTFAQRKQPLIRSAIRE